MSEDNQKEMSEDNQKEMDTQTQTDTQRVTRRPKKNILDTKGVVNYREAIELAYQVLRNQCTVQDIAQRLEDKSSYRFTILDETDVDTPKDKIYITMKNGNQMTFSKTRFLMGKRLRFDLIKFYSSKDLYISGPSVVENFYNDREVPVNSWVIDISPFRKKEPQISFAGDSD